MAFQLSPGVNVSEIDLTQVIPPPSTSVGAIAGNFEWGPALEITQITSEKDLVQTFGKPTILTANTFFAAASFLSYSSDLRVVRSLESAGTGNATNDGSSATIENKGKYQNSFYDATSGFTFAARYPGTLGNGLRIDMFANTNATAWSSWAYNGYFDRIPGTSQFFKSNFANTIANDEIHIVVVDGEGKFSGTANTVLERYAAVSKARNAKTPDGQSNWWRDVILRESKYIYVTDKPSSSPTGAQVAWDSTVVNATASFANTTSTTSYTLTGGALAAPTIAQYINAYDLFKTDDLGSDISLLMTGGDFQSGATSVASIAKHCVENIAEVRKDIVVFLSPDRANVVSATNVTGIVDCKNGTGIDSSYAVMDSGWKYMYDKYNEIYRWVPLNGDIAGLCAKTDLERDPWWSPAGLNRGQIKNAIKLAINPTKAQRDTLYKNGINPVVSSSGEGTILFGDKTMQGYASAFDRINVRRLFITLEKAISRAARTSLFEFNDEFTRAQFVNLVEPFLRTVQGRRGIYDFRVVCDETNNTPDVIDRNEFVGDIYVKPARSINFIQLNFVAVPTGVSFEEIVGQF